MPNQATNPNPRMQDILIDCRMEAEEAERQLGEAIQCLRERNHFGALGSLSGIESRIQYILAVLMRFDRIRTAKSRERESSKQQK